MVTTTIIADGSPLVGQCSLYWLLLYPAVRLLCFLRMQFMVFGQLVELLVLNRTVRGLIIFIPLVAEG